MRRPAALASFLLLLLPVAVHGQTDLSPKAVLGKEPGTDGHLFEYREILGYFETVAAASPRVRLIEVGTTTEGERMVMAAISSPGNIERLEELRSLNVRLADPRERNASEDAPLIAKGKVFVLVNASIHSSEVGPAQASLGLLHELATAESWAGALENVVVLLNPCHNPDGYIRFVGWWKRTRTEEAPAGAPMPWLYHRYVGHDNNRDWFLLTQKESMETVAGMQRRFRPQITVDQHQMGGVGARMFIPPYQDPYEPNIPPTLRDSIHWLGLSVLGKLKEDGLMGVWCRRQFDAWSPSRAFMHYHGGVRFLTEVASVRVADPVENSVPPRGDAAREGPHNPLPWKGGRWALQDVLRYTQAAAKAVILHAAQNREEWLLRFAKAMRESIEVQEPAAFVFPADEPRQLATAALLRAFHIGGVDVLVTDRPIESNGRTIPSGSLFVRAGDPAFPWVKALLENTPYPEVKDDRGRQRRPYDITTHCLPLFFDLPVCAVSGTVTSRMAMVFDGDLSAPPIDHYPVARAEVSPGTVLDARCESAHLRALTALRKGRTVSRVRMLEGAPAGGFVVDPTTDAKDLARLRAPVIGFYESWLGQMDEGWTRFFFDHLDIPFVQLRNAHLRDSKEPLPCNVLVLQDLEARQLVNGRDGKEIPEAFRGGIGESGAKRVVEFVQGGGTLIAIGGSASWAIEAFGLRVREVETRTRQGEEPEDEPAPQRFSVPGALLWTDHDASHPLCLGLERRLPVLWNRSRAFEPLADGAAEPVMRVAKEGILASGWGEGLETIAGRSLVLAARHGKGRIVLFGFDPLFRTWTWGTFRVFLNACLLAEADS